MTEQQPRLNRPDSYIPLPMQRYRGRARAGTIMRVGSTMIYVGPNPESVGPRPGPPVLNVGIVGEEWETVAVFPNATAAEKFIRAVEEGTRPQQGS